MSATLALETVVKEYPGGVAALRGVSIDIADGCLGFSDNSLRNSSAAIA